MSLLPLDAVTTAIDSIGANVSDSVAQSIACDAEYRLREVISIASKFKKHAKRSTLIPQDINNALTVKNIQPIYGYASQTTAYTFKSTLLASTKLYYIQDDELDLDSLVNRPLPSVPVDVCWTSHWLAVEGVQPAIVQNPTVADIRAASASISTDPSPPHSQTQTQPVQISNPDTATINAETLTSKVLSKELQLYHDKIMESVLSVDAGVIQGLALDSLESDPGIQPLLPYFVQGMTQKITKNIRNLKVLWAMMRMTRALLNNKNIFIEPYLHQLMPNIITCIVSKRLCESPSEDHHALRRFAGDLVAHVCHKYNATYPTLQPRVTKTLLRAFLDAGVAGKPPATVYGAVYALSRFGSKVIELVVRPNVSGVVDALLSDRSGGGDGGGVDGEVDKVLDVIVDILSKHIISEYIENGRGAEGVNRESMEAEIVVAFGEIVGKRVAANVWESVCDGSGGGGGGDGMNVDL